MRDNVIMRGRVLPFAVCRVKGIGKCDAGIFSLSLKEVAFQPSSGTQLFAVAPADVTSVTTQDNVTPEYRDVSIEVRIASKDYTFDPFPTGAPCDVGVHLNCSLQGMNEERQVADYIASTIPRIVAGELSPAPDGSGPAR